MFSYVSGKIIKLNKRIRNYFTLKITNTLIEGKNNIAKLFQRIAFGYRNKNNYIKKLYLCL